MRYKVLAGCFLLFLAADIFAQTGTIKGVAINSRTYERLPFASAFINNTTIGTSANEKGEFVLKNIPIGQHELVVTFVGHHHYQSQILIKDTTAITITVRLKSTEMREVKVNSKRDKNWQRQYEKFKKLFLGNTVHALRCEILNPWVLDFETNNVGYFKARASDVLQVENYSLGYKLFYQLKTFSISTKEFTISGNIRFKPMETSDTATMNQWIKNRQEVYEGSARHLFRSIVERRVAEEGFQLYRDNTRSGDIIRMAGFLTNVGKEITHYDVSGMPYDQAIPGEYKIQFPERMEVHYLYKRDEPRIYRNVTHPVSWVEVENDMLIINSQGIVLNPYNMLLLGIMGGERVAQFLPYDFIPLKTKRQVQQPVSLVQETKPVNPLSYLLEKPYLHTDKSYYYPNETVWFRGYMNYFAPVFKDSLSHVIYVDLIDKSKAVVLSKIFPIMNGAIEGSFSVPPTIAGGDYVIRAYTRWQLNFDPSLIFLKPIKVLEYTEVGRSAWNGISYDSTNALKIILDKDTFKTREAITVKLGVKGFLENFVPANFSISVTDVKQAVPAPNETSILSQYKMPEITLPDSLSKDVEFRIQQGIDLKGRFVLKKDKPSQGVITVIQENTSEVFMITTEVDGRFAFNNLKLYDSAKLSVMAKTLKGKRGKVLLDSVSNYSLVTSDIEPLKIDVSKESNPSKYNSTTFSDARLLDEVVIHEARELPKNSSVATADVLVTGNFLRATNANNILLPLQSRVPGLRVVNGLLLMGGPVGYGNGSGEDVQPLVLIDGIAVNSNDGFESIVERLSSMSPQEIEQIEVYKYSSGAAYGARAATGVISITTRKSSNDFTASNRELAKFDEIRVMGFSEAKRFYSPNYATPGDNARADYRSTIYWNPYVRTGQRDQARVTFYAADLPTQYRIVVEGLAEDGRTVRAEKLITVEERQ